jgi:hypothetical protein
MGLIFIEVYLGVVCIWKMRLHYTQANGILTVFMKAVLRSPPSSSGIICVGCNFSFRRPKKVTSKGSLRCKVAVIPFSPQHTYDSEGMW